MSVDWGLSLAVCNVMEEIGEKRFIELEKALADGTAGNFSKDLDLPAMGPERALEVFEAARLEYEHDMHIINGRKLLHKHIENAQNEISLAQGVIRELDRIGDAEYENGSRDLEKFLEDAARMLRAANAVKATDKNGN